MSIKQPYDKNAPSRQLRDSFGSQVKYRIGYCNMNKF